VAALPFGGGSLLHDHMTDVPVGSHSEVTTVGPAASQGEVAAAAAGERLITVSPPASDHDPAAHSSGMEAALSSLQRLGMLPAPGREENAALKAEDAKGEEQKNPKIILGKVLLGPVLITNSSANETSLESRDDRNVSVIPTSHWVVPRSQVEADRKQDNVSLTIMSHYKEKIAEFANTLETALNQVNTGTCVVCTVGVVGRYPDAK
jgi:hypothetical protein